MSDETPRLNLDTFEQGDTDWDHTDTVEALDEHAIARGPIAERPSEGDYDDELYYATDQRILWGWDAGAADWTARGGLGSEDDPVPGTTYREAVSAEVADIKNQIRPRWRADDVFASNGKHVFGGEDIDDIVVVEGESSDIEQDNDNRYIGESSLKITGDVRVRFDFDSAKDLSAWAPSIAFYHEGFSGSVDLFFYTDGANSAVYRQRGWHNRDEYWTRMDGGREASGGTDFDTMINGVGVDIDGSDSPVWIDDYRLVRRQTGLAPAVLLIIDNPEHDDDDYMLDGATPFDRLMEEYGIRATMGICGSFVEDADNVDLEFLQDAQSRGWELANRGYGDLGSDDYTDFEEVNQEVRKGKRWMYENGLNTDPAPFNPIGGSHTAEAARAIKKWHPGVIHNGIGIHSPQLTTGSITKRQIEGNFGPGEHARNYVRYAERTGTIVALYWHNRNVSESELRGFCKWLKDRRANVIQYRDLYAANGGIH